MISSKKAFKVGCGTSTIDNNTHHLVEPCIQIPLSENQLPKHVDFILDVSSSMYNNNNKNRVHKSIDVICNQIHALDDNDTLSIITFDTYAQRIQDKITKKQFLIQYNKSNSTVEYSNNDNVIQINKDHLYKWVSEASHGGTNFLAAFDCLEPIENLESRQRTILFVTDGQDTSETIYANIMESLANKFGNNLPTIVPVAIGDGTDNALLKKISDRTNSVLVEISDSMSDEAITENFKKVEKFFQVRTETVVLEVKFNDQYSEFYDLGQCHYDTIITRVLQIPNNAKSTLFFHYNDQKEEIPEYRMPSEKNETIIAEYVFDETTKIFQEIQEIYGIQSGGTTNSNGKINLSSVTMLVNNFGNKKPSKDEQEKEETTNKLTQVKEKLIHLKKQLPDESMDTFINGAISYISGTLDFVEQAVSGFRNSNQFQDMFRVVTQLISNNRTKLVYDKIPELFGKHRITKEAFQQISRDIDFADRKSLKNIISIDGSIVGRPPVLLELESSLIENFAEVIKFTIEKSTDPVEQLQAISFLIHEAFEQNVNKELKPTQEQVNFGKRTLHCESLYEFFTPSKTDVNESALSKDHPPATCVHHALLSADILGRLVANGTLPKGKVYHYRGTANNFEAHAWVIYETEEGKYRYLFDSTNPNKIYDLNNEEHKQWAITDYSKNKNLSGLFDNGLGNATPISPKILSQLTEKQIQEAYRLGFMCPYSWQLMLDPVTPDNGKTFFNRSEIDNVCTDEYQNFKEGDFVRYPQKNKEKLDEIKIWLKNNNILLPEQKNNEIELNEIGTQQKLAAEKFFDTSTRKFGLYASLRGMVKYSTMVSVEEI